MVRVITSYRLVHCTPELELLITISEESFMVRSLRNIITLLTLITTLVITVRQLKDAIDAFKSRKEAEKEACDS